MSYPKQSFLTKQHENSNSLCNFADAVPNNQYDIDITTTLTYTIEISTHLKSVYIRFRSQPSVEAF